MEFPLSPSGQPRIRSRLVWARVVKLLPLDTKTRTAPLARPPPLKQLTTLFRSPLTFLTRAVQVVLIGGRFPLRHPRQKCTLGRTGARTVQRVTHRKNGPLARRVLLRVPTVLTARVLSRKALALRHPLRLGMVVSGSPLLAPPLKPLPLQQSVGELVVRLVTPILNFTPNGLVLGAFLVLKRVPL